MQAAAARPSGNDRSGDLSACRNVGAAPPQEDAMVATVGTSAWLAMITALLCCNPTSAGLNEGLAALSKADYAMAVKALRPLADRGDAEAQYRSGLMYEFGRGDEMREPPADR